VRLPPSWPAPAGDDQKPHLGVLTEPVPAGPCGYGGADLLGTVFRSMMPRPGRRARFRGRPTSTPARPVSTLSDRCSRPASVRLRLTLLQASPVNRRSVLGDHGRRPATD